MKPLRVNVLSESVYGKEGQGVHTAFVDTVAMLKSRPDVEVQVNGREPADVVHAHTFGPLYWLRRHTAPRRIMSAHVIPESMEGSLVGWRWWQGAFTRYITLAYNSVHAVVAVSPAVARRLREIGVKRRVEVVPNPVDRAAFRSDPALRASGRQMLHLDPSVKVALCVGQIQPRKGVADFAAAAEACPEVKFVWIGGRPFGRLTDSYSDMNRIMEAGPGNLVFAGTFDLTDMPALYCAADLFFFPSFQENCALAIVEAAASGLPLLLRELPEYRELYGDSFLSATDAAGFIQAIRAFFSLPETHAEWRSRALRMAGQYDSRVICDTLVKLYQEVAGM